MPSSLHRWLVASIAVAVTRSSFAAEVPAAAPPLRSVTVSVQADHPDVVLDAPRTEHNGASDWVTVCALPCEGLRLSPLSSYRVAGAEILPSDPFGLLPNAESQVVTVSTKTPDNRKSARGLMIGGLVGVGVGAAILIPSVVAANSFTNQGEDGVIGAFGFATLAALGVLVTLAGAIIATIGGINLANCDTTVTVRANPG